jgi:hypothetical protein
VRVCVCVCVCVCVSYHNVCHTVGCMPYCGVCSAVVCAETALFTHSTNTRLELRHGKSIRKHLFASRKVL